MSSNTTTKPASRSPCSALPRISSTLRPAPISSCFSHASCAAGDDRLEHRAARSRPAAARARASRPDACRSAAAGPRPGSRRRSGWRSAGGARCRTTARPPTASPGCCPDRPWPPRAAPGCAAPPRAPRRAACVMVLKDSVSTPSSSWLRTGWRWLKSPWATARVPAASSTSGADSRSLNRIASTSADSSASSSDRVSDRP